MKTNVKLPAPILSQLKEVNIELCMKGRHYAEIAVSDGQLPEEVALGILKDLMDEDANKLTLNEERYLFTMVKIYSLENKYEVTVGCTHTKEDGNICGCENTFKFKLSDGDLVHPPKNYKVPVIDFVVTDTKKEYLVMPPTIDMECAVLNWFLTEKGITRDDLLKDKKQSFDFTFTRSVMHLIDKETNERIIKEITDFENVSEMLDKNDYPTIHKLYEKVEEVNKYGLAPKLYEITCKECGGRLVYSLPLLDGLTG